MAYTEICVGKNPVKVSRNFTTDLKENQTSFHTEKNLMRFEQCELSFL